MPDPSAFHAKPTSFKDLVADSIKLIERQARDRQITINTRNSAKIDEINLDPDRINQILLNLYLNAIEAMEPGGKLQIEIFDSDENSQLNIRVADTGKGIAEKDLPKIFDPYFTTKSSGTGLGLAIAHNIVEAMGGTIEVKSEAGKGTAFTLRLPIGV